MMHYTVFDPHGRALWTGNCADHEFDLIPVPPGHSKEPLRADPGKQAWADGALVDVPDQPTPHHVWQSGQWVDPRTADEVVRADREVLQAAVQRGAQALLDAKARERRWDDLASLRAALGSPNRQWHAEAQDGLRWHAEVWQHLFDLERDVLAGAAPEPAGADDVLATLPPLRWHDE